MNTVGGRRGADRGGVPSCRWTPAGCRRDRRRRCAPCAANGRRLCAASAAVLVAPASDLPVLAQRGRATGAGIVDGKLFVDTAGDAGHSSPARQRRPSSTVATGEDAPRRVEGRATVPLPTKMACNAWLARWPWPVPARWYSRGRFDRRAHEPTTPVDYRARGPGRREHPLPSRAWWTRRAMWYNADLDAVTPGQQTKHRAACALKVARVSRGDGVCRGGGWRRNSGGSPGGVGAAPTGARPHRPRGMRAPASSRALRADGERC